MSSSGKVGLKAFGVVVASLLWSSASVAMDATKFSSSEISPAASFAPANTSLAPEKLSPVSDPENKLTQVEEDPAIKLRDVPEEEQAKKAYFLAREAFGAGNIKRAINYIQFSAEKGYLLAQWKLGKAFRDGLGVEKDDVEAFKWLRVVADRHDPNQWHSRRNLRATVSALVALADYSRVGLAGTAFAEKNPGRSLSLYHYAASQYGHPGAQYALGEMYLNGEGGLEKNLRVGMRWLMLASRKSFAKAQAKLGDIYLSHKNNPKHRLTGLMWHRMAEKSAESAKNRELLARSGEIFAKASNSERELAVSMMVKMQESYDISPVN